MRRLTSALAATTLVAAGLAACGGGGTHPTPPPAIPAAPANATAAPKNAGRAGASMVVKFTKAGRRAKTARRRTTGHRQAKFVDPNYGTLHFVATSADGSATATSDVAVDTEGVASTGQQTVTGIPIFAPAGTLQITELDNNGNGYSDDPGAPMATATVTYQNVAAGGDTTLTYTGNPATDTLQSPLVLAAVGDVLWFEDTNANLWLTPVPFFGNGGVEKPITVDVAAKERAGFYLDGDGSGNCQAQFTLPLHLELDDSQEAVTDGQGFPLFPMPTLTVTGSQTIANPAPPVPTSLPTAVPTGSGSFSSAYDSSIAGYSLTFPFIDPTGASVTQVTGYLSWTGIDPLTLASSTFRVPITIVGPPVGDATHYPGTTSCAYVAPGGNGTPPP